MSSNNYTESLSCNTIHKSSSRLSWIDWMKTIGIGLMTYGHFFSIGDKYIYVFHVPLFFLISGFLCKKETDNRLFWKKLWNNLIIPMVIICSINYPIEAAGRYFFTDNPIFIDSPLIFYGKMIIGISRSLGTLWFVYTLIVLKIILQYTPKSYIHILWFILFLIIAYIINNYNIEILGFHPFDIAWAVPNAFVAYPFFIIGHFLRKWKTEISNYQASKYTFCCIAISLIVIYMCGHNHKYVYLWTCGYGDNILLFILGGLVGSTFVYLLSKVLEDFNWKWVTDISVGTLIILGFHPHLIAAVRYVFPTPTICDALLALIVLITFIPIIHFIELHFPILIGKYRLNWENTNTH